MTPDRSSFRGQRGVILLYTQKQVLCDRSWFNLVKQGDVQREAKAISQVDLVRQSVAELTGRGGGVRQESLGGAIHKRYWQHDGLLRFGGLRGKTDQIQVQVLLSDHMN